MATEGNTSTTPKLSELAFEEACDLLEKSIVGEQKCADFVCGGSIAIVTSNDGEEVDTAGIQASSTDTSHTITETSTAEGGNSLSLPGQRSSPPVRIFWTSKDEAKTDEPRDKVQKLDSRAQKLILPLNSKNLSDSNMERLHQLVADCEPASFGRGQEDVLDPEYRMAGKLDAEQFASSFHPADFGIIENIEQILLPRFNSDNENYVWLRRLRVELYKLNVCNPNWSLSSVPLIGLTRYTLDPLVFSRVMLIRLVPKTRSAR